jgi:hypothetical protein
VTYNFFLSVWIPANFYYEYLWYGKNILWIPEKCGPLTSFTWYVSHVIQISNLRKCVCHFNHFISLSNTLWLPIEKLVCLPKDKSRENCSCKVCV